MTYTFKTFGPQPDGTYRYKVYNGPMGIAPRTVQERPAGLTMAPLHQHLNNAYEK